MWARRIKLLGAALGATYVALAGVVSLSYRAFLYPAKKQDLDPMTSVGSLVRIEREGEPTVFALYAPAPKGAPTLVRFHGNGEDLVDEAAEVRAYHDLGLGVLSVEYPGYGLAREQKATEATLYGAGERAIGFLNQSGVAKDDVVVLGFSLGSGVATEMARRGLASKLILMAPYTSIPDMVSRFVPILPTNVLVGDHFDTLSKAPAIDIPTFVVHGDEDALIPPTMGDRVAGAFPKAKLHVVRGGHHNDLCSRDPDLRRRIARFARGEDS
jgi:pimeloyl-ACP methyl ester carboxylesterase